MGQVIALDMYRQRLQEGDAQPLERPVFSAGDVWGRDYTDMEAVVFGLLKAREAMRYYTDYPRVLETRFLEALEAAHTVDKNGTTALREAIEPLKDHLLEHMAEGNMKHMKTAMILLDLIEKSPALKP